MGKPIEMTQQEREFLFALTRHPGWEVLTKLMETLCREATEQVILCEPTDDKKILALQATARATNKFSADLRKNVQWNVDSGVAKVRAEQEELAGKA